MLSNDRNASKRSENDIVNLIAGFLVGEGYRVFCEVCSMNQRVDIIAQKNRWLTAIEVKKGDWRKALWQCRAHEPVVDFVCIAIGTVGVSDALSNAIKQAGYGLWHCPPGGVPSLVIPPKRKKMFWKTERNQLNHNKKGGQYER